MLKFHTIGQIEKNYAFENAVATADTFNGAFGVVADGEFTVGADASKAIMNLEVGDEANLGTYPIKKGTQVRVLDLEAFNGKTIEVYGDELPDGVVVGDTAFEWDNKKWKVRSCTYNGSYNAKKQYTISIWRSKNFPAQV